MKPAESGFRMPAEWEPHAGTWLTFPRNEGISFPGKFDAISPIYAELIRQLTSGEDVYLNVWDARREGEVRETLARFDTPMERVKFFHHPAYEPWCRDHGPIFVVKDEAGGRERAVVNWEYNAWGGKYPPYDLDNEVPRRVAQVRGLECRSPGIVIEGGSIEVNGRGTLMTTEACLLNPNRNPHLGKEQIEACLRDYLGVRHFLWLGDGIAGDDTDGHIDDLARFVAPDTVVTVVENDPVDENYGVLQENLRRLKAMKDQDGRSLKVVELPMPGIVEFQGERLPASYANFYIGNSVVVMPAYNHPNDTKAQGILQDLFPDRRVVGIDSTDLVWGLGSFHCITQQEPAAAG